MRSSLRAGASVTDTDFWAPVSTSRAAWGESVKIGFAPARLSMKACVVGSSWLMRFLRCYSPVLHPGPYNRSEYGWCRVGPTSKLSGDGDVRLGSRAKSAIARDIDILSDATEGEALAPYGNLCRHGSRRS